MLIHKDGKTNLEHMDSRSADGTPDFEFMERYVKSLPYSRLF